MYSFSPIFFSFCCPAWPAYGLPVQLLPSTIVLNTLFTYLLKKVHNYHTSSHAV